MRTRIFYKPRLFRLNWLFPPGSSLFSQKSKKPGEFFHKLCLTSGHLSLISKNLRTRLKMLLPIDWASWSCVLIGHKNTSACGIEVFYKVRKPLSLNSFLPSSFEVLSKVEVKSLIFSPSHSVWAHISIASLCSSSFVYYKKLISRRGWASISAWASSAHWSPKVLTQGKNGVLIHYCNLKIYNETRRNRNKENERISTSPTTKLSRSKVVFNILV